MKSFLEKIAMLFSFIFTVLLAWAAFSMMFDYVIVNWVLGILALWFLFRSLDLADKINKYGSYSEKEEKDKERDEEPQHHDRPQERDWGGPRFGSDQPEDGSDLMEE